MHEVGIAQDLIEHIKETTRGGSVKRVNIKLGRLSGIDPESLKFGFQISSARTELEGVEINIEEIDGKEILIDSLEIE